MKKQKILHYETLKKENVFVYALINVVNDELFVKDSVSWDNVYRFSI